MTVQDTGQDLLDDRSTEWQPIAIAPYGVDLELAVINGSELHAVVFSCRRDVYGWVNAVSGAPVQIQPTHWRPWA